MTLKKLSTLAHQSVLQKLFSNAMRVPNFYTGIMLPVALLGYAYLLLFPVTFIFGAGKITHILLTTPLAQFGYQLGNIALWVGIMVVSAITTRQILELRFLPPEGLSINKTTAVKLYNLLDQTKQQIKIPKIDRVIITEQLSIDIIKTPRFPLPVWSVNTLVVGLPLMQCLSPEYFKCAMVRKLIQHSKQENRIPKFLAQLRNVWPLYEKKLSLKKSRNNLALYPFFKVYSKIYRFLSIPVANHVELLADRATLKVINDEDLLQTIEKLVVTKIYLEKQYWPKIQNMVSHNRYQPLEPYSKLEQILQTGLTPQLSKRWLDTLYCFPQTAVMPVPDLRSRMNNIGRSKVRIPEKTGESAAHYFLDKSYRDIVSEVNHMWLIRSSQYYEQPGIIQSPANQVSTPLHGAASRINSELFN